MLFPKRNTRLNKASYRLADMIISDITHSPNGYLYWFGLPSNGKHSRNAMRSRWAHCILRTLLPDTFLATLLLAALSVNGVPTSTSTPLYRWLLVHVYSN